MKKRNTKLFAGVAVGVVVLFILIIVLAASSQHSAKQMATENQNKSGNVGSAFNALGTNAEAEVEHKLNNEVRLLKSAQQAASAKTAAAMAALKAKLMSNKGNTHNQQQINELQQKYKQLLTQQQQKDQQIDQLEQKIQQKQSSKSTGGYAVGSGDVAVASGGVHWVTDVTIKRKKSEQGMAGNNPLGDDGFNLFGKSGDKTNDSQSVTSAVANQAKKLKKIPAFSIPTPSVMTQVIPLMPLIGRVPRGEDHSVWSPFQFVFIVEHPNITANGHHLSPRTGKMMGSAVCVGDFMSHSVSCYIKTLTYIFPDGRIATVKAGNKDDLTSGLGYITDSFGNPQIRGELKTSLGLRLGVSAAMAGIQGYGQALSQAQIEQMGSQFTPLWNRVTNANQYAIGQAASNAAQNAQTEWSNMEKNMFDYVFVPNWNPQTHKLLRLNLVITQQLNFDYDQKGRKLDYDNQDNGTHQHFIL